MRRNPKNGRMEKTERNRNAERTAEAERSAGTGRKGRTMTEIMKGIGLAGMMILTAGTVGFAQEAAEAQTEWSEETGKDEKKAEVFVSISSEGKLTAAQEAVTVTDADADGLLTVNDALLCAHEKLYKEEDGYAFEKTEYGLSITALWGVENGGSYGCYVNNVSVLSMADEIKDEDQIYAYSFADLENWSDTYCYFDTARLKEDGTVQLFCLIFDENWNPVKTPLEGAVILIDDEETGFVTDKDGKAALHFDKEGTCVISAKCEEMIITPPVCIAEL